MVGVPIFFASQLGWSFDQIGLFMAAWIVGYGIIQAFVPRLTKNTTDAQSGARAAAFWGFALAVLPALMAGGLYVLKDHATLILVGGLLVFALIFAINSSLHSFLIVAYSDADKVSLSVGFYYMANAIGRLLGTLLSGLVYQLAGLEACLVLSATMVLVRSHQRFVFKTQRGAYFIGT